MNHGKTRASLFGIVGAYLLYTAYQLFEGRNDPNTTMTSGLMILFIVLFGLAGIALVAAACRMWKQAGKEEEKPPADDGKSLK